MNSGLPYFSLAVIDAHVHFGGPESGDDPLGGAFKEMITELDKNGVDKAVIFSSQTPDFHSANEQIKAATTKASGRLIPFVRVNPWDRAVALEELTTRVRLQGWRGVKLHPTLQGFGLVSAIAFPIYDVVAKLRVPILVHTGNEMYNTPAQLGIVAEMYPDVTFIMGHMGGFLFEEALMVARRCDNIMLESSEAKCIKVRRAVEAIGSQRVVWGSDYPTEIMAYQLIKIEMAGLPSKDKENVLGDSIAAMLHL